MKKQKEILKSWNINKNWTLFLDRDGVINKKLENDYVKSWKEFEFLPNVIKALQILRKTFGKIIIITNQRGIGRGLMTEKDLLNIHTHMLKIFEANHIKIDTIYYCPHDYEKESCSCRKPNIGMALKAKEDFLEIDFFESIVAGDSVSDMELAGNIGAKKIFISNCENSEYLNFTSLYDFANTLEANK